MTLTVSHVGQPGAWTGLIKRGKEVVWRCPHSHRNRDYDTDSNTAARACAGRVLEALTDPDKTRAYIESLTRWSAPCLTASQVAGVRITIAQHQWALEIAESLRQDLIAVPA